MKRKWASVFLDRKRNKSFEKRIDTNIRLNRKYCLPANTQIKKRDRLKIFNNVSKVLYSIGILFATGFLAWSTYLLNESSKYADKMTIGKENNVFWEVARKALDREEKDKSKMFQDAEKINGILERITSAINYQGDSFKKTHDGVTRSDYISRQKTDLNILYRKSVERISVLTNFYSSFVFGESKEAILLHIPKLDDASIVLIKEDEKDRDIFEMEKKLINSVDRNARLPEYPACEASLAILDKKYLVAIKKYEKDDYFVSWIYSIESSLGKVSGIKQSAVKNSENLRKSLTNAVAKAVAEEKDSECSNFSTLQDAVICESDSSQK